MINLRILSLPILNGLKQFALSSVLTAAMATLSMLGLSYPSHADTAAIAPVPGDPASVIQLPPGFTLNVFARLSGSGSARFMTIGPDGNLYLSLASENKVLMLPDRNRDGVAGDQMTGPVARQHHRKTTDGASKKNGAPDMQMSAAYRASPSLR